MLFNEDWGVDTIALEMLLDPHDCERIAPLKYESVFVRAVLRKQHVPQKLLRTVQLRLLVHLVRILLDEGLNRLVQVTLDGLVANHLVQGLVHEVLHPAASCTSTMTLIHDLEEIMLLKRRDRVIDPLVVLGVSWQSRDCLQSIHTELSSEH